MKKFISVILSVFFLLVSYNPAQAVFRFISWSDAQDGGVNLKVTAEQASLLKPDFTIFNGDLESKGFAKIEMDTEISALNGGSLDYKKGNGLFAKTFFVRGNHDDRTADSAASWQNYFLQSGRSLPAGATNYIGINSDSTYLLYSFDYENSRFIGLDYSPSNPNIPGSSNNPATPLGFVYQRLTDATERGLTHAFLFLHVPFYCVESQHCNCPSVNGNCTPSSIVALLNQFPIISATFHGHEHILSWTHLDKSRLPNLTNSYEQFITSPSGSGTYNKYLYTERTDYANLDNKRAFAAIDVNGKSYKVSFYRVGTAEPVWSKTFSKEISPEISPIQTHITPIIPVHNPNAEILNNIEIVGLLDLILTIVLTIFILLDNKKKPI